MLLLLLGHLANQVHLLFLVGNLLEGLKLVLTHDVLAHVNSQQVASVTNVAETEVQVVAVEADPVADPFSECSLLASI